MPRKRKGQSDWVKEFPEDLETQEKWSRTDECVSSDNSDSSKVEVALVCKFCSVEIDVDPKKKPWDRIQEHLASARHKKLKDSNKQLTIYETEVRQRQKEKEAESAYHDFVRALSYSAISLNHADGFIGKLFKKYCPAARWQLEQKYLPEVYAQHKDLIKQEIVDRKVSVIMDESPEVLGRPTVNTMKSL